MRTTLLFAAALTAALFGCSSTLPLEHPAVIAASPVTASEIIALDAGPANKFVRADERGEVLVRLRLAARTLRDVKRPPINLALVVDTSGSMEGDAIRDARAASLALVDALNEGDTLAVISFNTETEVLLPATRLDAPSMARVRARIGAMAARGTTDLAGGLKAGLDEVARGYQQSGINRVVLLGDGVPNDARPMLGLAKEAAQRAIPVTVMGLGLDYDETLMNTIAQQSGGKYHFIRESSQVASLFKDEVLRLKRVAARNAALRLVPGPGVTIKEIIGVPSTQQGNDARIGLGDLSEGEQRDVVVRLAVTGRRAGALVELLDTELSFDDATSGGGRLSERSFVGARSTADLAQLAAGRDVEIERSAARAAVADGIVRAIAMARAGNLDGARRTLDDAEREARAAAKTLDDGELEEKAKSIWPLRKSLPSLTPEPQVSAPTPTRPASPGVKPVAAPEPEMPRPMAASIVMDTQAAAVRTLQGR